MKPNLSNQHRFFSESPPVNEMTNKWSLFDLFLRYLLQHVIQSNHGHHKELSDTDQHMIILNVNCP